MGNSRSGTLIRGTLCHLTGNPFKVTDESSVVEWHEDGGMLIDNRGLIVEIGPFHQLANAYPASEVVDRTGCVIIPGLIDCHTHYPQTFIVGSCGEELLDWLERYTFPEEARFRDPAYARHAAETFFQEAIAQGTTTALIFGSCLEETTSIAFEEAQKLRFRAIMGVTLSDMNLPGELKQTPAEIYDLSSRLIRLWHNQSRSRYAISPRFAPTCSPEMLSICGQLLSEFPGLYLQTHINENLNELALIKRLFPDVQCYLDVYDRHGLLGPRTILAHSIYSTDREIQRISDTGCAIAHCPSSNLFLGSGLLPLRAYLERNVKIALGTDIAAGDSFSILSQMNQAYKIQMLQRCALGRSLQSVKLTGIQLFYLGTLAGAESLGLEEVAGSFKPGAAADLVVIDPRRDSYFDTRFQHTESLEDRLFLLSTLGHKSIIAEVYTEGKRAYKAPAFNR